MQTNARAITATQGVVYSWGGGAPGAAVLGRRGPHGAPGPVGGALRGVAVKFVAAGEVRLLAFATALPRLARLPLQLKECSSLVHVAFTHHHPPLAQCAVLFPCCLGHTHLVLGLKRLLSHRRSAAAGGGGVRSRCNRPPPADPRAWGACSRPSQGARTGCWLPARIRNCERRAGAAAAAGLGAGRLCSEQRRRRRGGC